MRESEIIALFFEDGPGGPGGLPADDCARVDAQTIVTTDALVEGTHFRRDWSGPEDLAHKLWNVNLSDIAASGGEAAWCLLNLGLPPELSGEWTSTFAAAFRTACSADGGRLIGGDTFRAGRITLSLTLAGELSRLPISGNAGDDAGENDRAYRYLSRDGARKGDAVYVSGTLGLSQLGFEILSGERPTIRADQPGSAALHAAALDRHLRPRARLEWSRALRSRPELSSMLDLSDGLYPDLLRLAEANPALVFSINCDRLPHIGRQHSALPEAATAGVQTLPSVGALTNDEINALALSSGEELELLFTAPPGMRFEFPCSEIGQVSAAQSEAPSRERVQLRNPPFGGPPRWFQHF